MTGGWPLPACGSWCPHHSSLTGRCSQSLLALRPAHQFILGQLILVDGPFGPCSCFQFSEHEVRLASVETNGETPIVYLDPMGILMGGWLMRRGRGAAGGGGERGGNGHWELGV